MTIYQRLLGEQFQTLHPKLQERYALALGENFYGKGTMHSIIGGNKLLKPFYHVASYFNFLFPEEGEDIPFTIRNTPYLKSNGEIAVYWERTFFFENRKRKFNATMTINPTKKIVHDYLGSPSLFYSELFFHVTKEGRLIIRSGKQSFVIGSKQFPIPKLLEGRVIVEEGYDEVKEVYTINVYIHNPLFGRLMMYAGEFTT